MERDGRDALVGDFFTCRGEILGSDLPPPDLLVCDLLLGELRVVGTVDGDGLENNFEGFTLSFCFDLALKLLGGVS